MQNFNDFAVGDSWPDLDNMSGYDNIVIPPSHSAVPRDHSAGEVTYVFSREENPRRQIQSQTCKPCKKRKSKCDATKPHCRTCTTQFMTPCNYDPEGGQRSKTELKQDVVKLEEMTANYQCIIDSLCLAEEPQLGELVRLIRSRQSIDVIVNRWRTGHTSTSDCGEAARLPNLERLTTKGIELGNSAGRSGSIQIVANPAEININHLVEAGRITININQVPIGVNQPQIPVMHSTVSDMLDPSSTLFMREPSVPPIPGQGLNDNGISTVPPDLHGYYNQWGKTRSSNAGDY